MLLFEVLRTVAASLQGILRDAKNARFESATFELEMDDFIVNMYVNTCDVTIDRTDEDGDVLDEDEEIYDDVTHGEDICEEFCPEWILTTEVPTHLLEAGVVTWIGKTPAAGSPMPPLPHVKKSMCTFPQGELDETTVDDAASEAHGGN